MIFSEDVLSKVIVFVLAIGGFLVARHIHNHKKLNAKPLVCPIQFDCATVVHSDYSRLLGIPVEIFGMLYYGIVAIGYGFLIFHPESISPHILGALILASSVAFFFSLYLIGVQIFVLKKGCSWCIVSAFICLAIFLVTVTHYDISMYVQELISF
jgi:uncharacterized membrane protein